MCHFSSCHSGKEKSHEADTPHISVCLLINGKSQSLLHIFLIIRGNADLMSISMYSVFHFSKKVYKNNIFFSQQTKAILETLWNKD